MDKLEPGQLRVAGTGDVWLVIEHEGTLTVVPSAVGDSLTAEEFDEQHIATFVVQQPNGEPTRLFAEALAAWLKQVRTAKERAIAAEEFELAGKWYEAERYLIGLAAQLGLGELFGGEGRGVAARCRHTP